MTRRTIPLSVAAGLLGACTSGPPSPPALAYGEQTVSAAAYDFSDTTSVDVAIMGQAMQLSQHGVAEYEVAFADDPAGVGVTLAVRSLSLRLNQPMGESVEVDESSVQGDLVFALDRRGDATVARRPVVADEASQMVSALGLAHTFFPALPGRAATPGDRWVDTLSFSGEDGPGSMSESSVLSYTVVGDTLVEGRSLLRIGVEGTTRSASEMEFSGVPVSQESELAVNGYVLWDPQAGIMFEQYREASGSGVVTVPLAPVPLPVSVRSVQRARLQN